MKKFIGILLVLGTLSQVPAIYAAANPISIGQANKLFCDLEQNNQLPDQTLCTKCQINNNPASMQYCQGLANAVQTQINNAGSKVIVPNVGDTMCGGTIFYVDTKYRRGLIAGPADAVCGTNTNFSGCSPGQQSFTWGAATGTGVQGAALFTGSINTSNMLTLDPTSQAALAAMNYHVTGDTNCTGTWYLPSINEISLMYVFVDAAEAGHAAPAGTSPPGNMTALTGFMISLYWSSTEYPPNPSNAWFINMNAGNVNTFNKTNAIEVRPIRAFSY